MGETRATNPLVLQFRRGGIPRELRLMAAQGALPLKPEDILELLHLLLGDKEEEIAKTAAASMAGLPAAELLPIFKEKSTPPHLLGWGLIHREEKELREAVLQNVSTPDEAVEALAPSLSEGLAELVVINQVRLLRRTTLLEALESNTRLNNDQKRRLRELRESFHIGEQPAEAAPPPAPPSPAPGEAEEPVEEVPMDAPPISEDEALVRYLSEDERKETEKLGAVQRLYRLNTAEKVITALKGTREERAILVRDPNRIVSTAVLGSPRITDPEIEAFAAMKSISGDILRQIGNNKDFTKRYGVISNLVKNPRTPLAISIGMVSRLNPRDLKSISVDRNVPEVIRKQAQKFVKASQSGPGERDKH